MDNSVVLPMHVKKAKGLAGLLEPEPEQEWRGYFGLIPADFEPHDPDHRPGYYRKSAVDGLLAPLEEHRELFDPQPHSLDTLSNWYEQLDLAPASRMRRNMRFQRFLEELCHPRKYSAAEKEQFLYTIKACLRANPDKAEFASPTAPMTPEEFREEFVKPFFPAYSQWGVLQKNAPV